MIKRFWNLTKFIDQQPFLDIQQYPEAEPELCLKVQTVCGQMTQHTARALRELASALQSMTTPSTTDGSDLSEAMKAASACRSELVEDAVQLQVMHTAVIASLLSDLVMQINKITESLDNLARLARFKNPEKTRTDVVINVKSWSISMNTSSYGTNMWLYICIISSSSVCVYRFFSSLFSIIRSYRVHNNRNNIANMIIFNGV